jgi:ribosomal protein S13
MANKKTTIAAEIKVDTGSAEKEVKGLKDDIQGVGKATEGSIAQLKELKKELKNTAAGSEDFKRLSAQIRDVEDGIENARVGANDFAGALENASGPIGQLGRGIRQLEIFTSSWGAALKATGIGLLVALVGTLTAAFVKNEGAMKKLEPIFTQFGRILNGILGVMQPFIDALINMATNALPLVSKGFQVAYSALASFLQGVGLVGSAVKKFISGDFAGAWDDAKKSVTEFGTRYEAANKRFIAGSKELTDAEKAEQAKRLADQKAFNEKQAAERKAAQEKRDAEEKARIEKAMADAKAYEDFDTALQQRLIEIEDEKAAKETQRLEKAAAEAKAYNDFDTKLQQDLLKVEEDATAKKIALADAELQAKLGLANAIGNIAGGLSALFEKGTTAAKIAGLAEIAIGTGVGFIQGLDIAQKGAKATGPAAPFAFPIFYATQIAAVLAAASRAKSVMTQVKGGSGISIPSFGAPSIPSVSANAPLAPSLQTTTLNQAQLNQIGNVAARAYVVESDISGNQERITRLNRAARIS